MKFQRRRYACVNCQRYKAKCTNTFPCKKCMVSKAECVKEAHSIPPPPPPKDPWLEYCAQRQQVQPPTALPPFHLLQAKLLLDSLSMNAQRAQSS